MGGHFYLLAESFILISLVALLGTGLGWWWRGLSFSKTRKELENLEEFQQRLQQRLAETERHATDLERLNADLRGSRHDLDLQLTSLTQEFENFREAHGDIDVALARKDSEIADKIAQIDELEKKLRAQLERAGQRGENASAEAEARIASLLSAVREKDLELEEQRAEVNTLQNLLGERDLSLENAAGASEMEERLASLKDSLGEFENELAAKNAHIESLETRLEAELSQAEAVEEAGVEESARLRQELEAYRTAIVERDRQLATLSDSLSDLQKQIQIQQAKSKGDESAEILALRSQIEALNHSLDERDRSLEKNNDRMESLEARIAGYQEQANEQLETANVMHDELLAFKSALDDRERSVATLQHKLTNIEASSKARIEDLEEDLRSAEDIAFNRESELARLRQQVEAYDNNSVDVLEALLEEADVSIADLQKQCDELREKESSTARAEAGYAREVESLQWSIAQKDNEISRLRRESAAANQGSSQESERDAARILELTEQLAMAEATLRQKESLIERLKQSRALSTANDLTSAPPPNRHRSDSSADDMIFDRDLGPVYRASPPHADDLTAIKGIAEVLSGKLNSLGIFTFKQIANWTDDQVEQFSLRLEFKDRIQRDKWIPQSQTLHEEKYGEKV